MKKNLLDTFWTLAQGNDEERLSTVHAIINILKENGKNDVAVSTELSYTLSRLLRGLASNRKLARLGYSLALSQILRAFPVITVSFYLEILHKELKARKAESKSEHSAMQLGQVMGYLALFQSDRFFTASEKEIRKILMSLNTIREEKPLLRHICSQTMVHIISKCGEKDFKTIVWPVLDPILSDGWETCNPEVLLLLLTTCKQHPNEIDKEYLLSKWSCKHLISEKHFNYISNILLKSAVGHPIVHPVCSNVLQSVLSRPKSFSNFWKTVIEDKLMKSTTKSYSHLGIELVHLVLPLITQINQLEIVMSSHFVSLLIKNLSSKKQPLHNAFKKLMERLVSFIKQCGDGHLQVALIKSLLTSPGTVLFDAITKTRTVASMTAELNTVGVKEMSSFVMDTIKTQSVPPSLRIEADGPESDDSDDTVSADLITQQKWALSVLSRLVTHVTMATDTEWTLHILKFLFIHGFCVVIKPIPRISGCEEKSVDYDNSIITILQGTFFQTLNRLATFKPERTSKSHLLYVNILYHVVQYAQSILNEKSSAIKMKNEFKDEIRVVWDEMRTVVDNIREKKETQGLLLAFELLFLHHGLQLFSEPHSAVNVLQELHVCYRKASQKKRRQSIKKIDSGEPEWVDVIVDLLMSLLAQESHLVRVVVNNVFLMLSPYLSNHSVQLIIDTLESTPDDDEGMLEFEDEESDVEMNESDDVSESIDENGEVDDSSDSSSDSDSHEDTEDEVDDLMKTSVKAALGNAAVESDCDDSEADLDDDAMLKLDGALAAVFRNMKKNKKKEKEKETQLKHYQMRCLDVLEILIRHNPSAGLLLKITLPLLRIIEKGVRTKSNQDLSNRATKVFHLLLKTNKLPPDPTVDRSMLPSIFVELMEYAAKVPGIQMVKEVASASLFMVRLMLGLEERTFPSPLKTRAMKSASLETRKKNNAEGEANIQEVHNMVLKGITDIIFKRNTKLNPLFFHTLLEREPHVMWPLADPLMGFITQDNLRIFSKTQACTMLALLINKSTVQNMDSDDWDTFARNSMMGLIKLVNDMTTNEVKPRFLHELINIISKIVAYSEKELLKEVIPDKLVQEVWEMKQHVTKDTRKICNKFLGVIKNRLNLDPDTSVKTTKRKHLNGASNVLDDMDHDEPKKKKEKREAGSSIENNNINPLNSVSAPKQNVKGKRLGKGGHKDTSVLKVKGKKSGKGGHKETSVIFKSQIGGNHLSDKKSHKKRKEKKKK